MRYVALLVNINWNVQWKLNVLTQNLEQMNYQLFIIFTYTQLSHLSFYPTLSSFHFRTTARRVCSFFAFNIRFLLSTSLSTKLTMVYLF